MTYQEIVNRIQSVVDQHWMLADFGYGDLSDLKTRFENTSGDTQNQANYPYLFLNPGTHTRNASSMTYNFNMIVMDMARKEVNDQPFNNMLAIQSQCQQYIDDVLGQLLYGFQDQPEVLRANIQYNPFNERFQDDVAGMTCSLSIEVPTPLNDCIAPFKSWQLVSTISANLGSNRYYNYGNFSDQWPIPTDEAIYKVVWTVLFEQNVDLTDDATPWDRPTFTVYVEQDAGGTADQKYIATQQWTSQVGTTIELTGQTIVRLEDLPPDSRDIFFGYGYLGATYPDGAPTTPVPNAIETLGGNIKIYKLM